MNSNRVLINPYAKRPAAAASENNDRVNNVAINLVVTDFTMGIQSQLRGGAIKNYKKMATKRKLVYKQRAVCRGWWCGLCISTALQKLYE